MRGSWCRNVCRHGIRRQVRGTGVQLGVGPGVGAFQTGISRGFSKLLRSHGRYIDRCIQTARGGVGEPLMKVSLRPRLTFCRTLNRVRSSARRRAQGSPTRKRGSAAGVKPNDPPWPPLPKGGRRQRRRSAAGALHASLAYASGFQNGRRMPWRRRLRFMPPGGSARSSTRRSPCSMVRSRTA